MRPLRLALLSLFTLAPALSCSGRVSEDGGSGGSSGGQLGDGGTGGWWSCLAEGTLVSTPTGLRKIETLGVGDLVLSYDEQRGVVRSNPITWTKTSEREVAELVFEDGSSLWSTAEHPFFDVDRARYVRAGELTADAHFLRLDAGPTGDASSLDSGAFPLERLTLAALPHFPATKKSRVFDLEIEGDHNFFAGGVLVHNKSGGAPSSGGAPAFSCDPGKPYVCSGDVVVVQFGNDQVVLPASGEGGAPGEIVSEDLSRTDGDAGGEGGGRADDDVVVAFDKCSYPQAPFYLHYFYVEPGQIVHYGSSDEPCVSEAPLRATANQTGRLDIPMKRYTHIRVPRAELGCLVFGSSPAACNTER